MKKVIGMKCPLNPEIICSRVYMKVDYEFKILKILKYNCKGCKYNKSELSKENIAKSLTKESYKKAINQLDRNYIDSFEIQVPDPVMQLEKDMEHRKYKFYKNGNVRIYDKKIKKRGPICKTTVNKLIFQKRLD